MSRNPDIMSMYVSVSSKLSEDPGFEPSMSSYILWKIQVTLHHCFTKRSNQLSGKNGLVMVTSSRNTARVTDCC